MEEFHSPAGRRRRGIIGWIIGILLLVLVVGLVASVLFFISQAGHYVIGPAPYFAHPFFVFFLFPLGFIFFILLIFLMFRLALWPWRRRYYRHWRSWDSAHEILRQRYARGEITKDQFEQMQRDLEQHE